VSRASLLPNPEDRWNTHEEPIVAFGPGGWAQYYREPSAPASPVSWVC